MFNEGQVLHLVTHFRYIDKYGGSPKVRTEHGDFPRV
jgi:hypothetical protein